MDFGADPFSFVVGLVERVIATSAAAELRTEVGALDLVELRMPRQASSPVVPETSIFSLTTGILRTFHHRVTEAQRKSLG